jgi:4-hydroxythreonine-4-phosphate dehydrogenase
MAGEPSRRMAVTPGMGVGPEVTLRAFVSHPQIASGAVLVGRTASVVPEAERMGLQLVSVHALDEPVPAGAVPFLDPGDQDEPSEIAAIRLSAHACMTGTLSAMVTGPIHKKKLRDRGFAFNGHTDFLEHLCGSRRTVMSFVGGELKVALVTTHVPLMAVGKLLDIVDIVRVVGIVAHAFQRDLGLERPRIAVCGLNPHAGEGGSLGTEELEIIGPACDLLRARNVAVVGPISAETAFLGARAGDVDVVVAMYHDQGLAPLKAVDFGRSVNWSLGLPIVRTSVDHGTADGLVGTGRADPASMVAALKLARRIVARRAKGA